MNEKIKLTNEQIAFFNSKRKDKETLKECALRLMGDCHRKFTQKKDNDNLIISNQTTLSSRGDCHPECITRHDAVAEPYTTISETVKYSY